MEVPGKKAEQMTGSVTDALEEVFKFTCDPCSTDGHQLPAAGFCVDCQHYLCDTCYQYHQRPMPSRHHVLQDKSEMPRQKYPTMAKDACTEKCQQHGGKLITYFCKSHDQVGCSACVGINHMVCKDVQNVDDIANGIEESEQYKDAIKKLKDIETRFINNNCKKEKIISTTEKYYTRVNHNLTNMRKEINSCFDSLEKEALDIKDNNVKMINTISETCNTAIQEIQALKSDLDTLNNSKHSKSLFIKLNKAKTEMTKFEDCLENMEKENKGKRTKFELDVKIKGMKKGIKSLGQLYEKKPPEELKPTHTGAIDVESSTDRFTCCITGMAILSNGQLAITDKNNKSVKLLDNEKMEIKSQLKLSSAPWDITEVNKGEVAVTIPGSKVIQFVSITDKLSRGHEIKVTDPCYGIVSTERQLAVTLGKSVAIMELNGTVLKNISFNLIFQHYSFYTEASYIAVSPDQKTLYVACADYIYSLTKEGESLARYEGFELKGICVDEEGIVYACALDSIHQVTGNLTKLQVLKTNIRTPWAIAYNNSDDKFYIGTQTDNVIKVYALK